MRDVDMA